MKTLCFAVCDLFKNFKQSFVLALVIVLGISSALCTHLIASGVIEYNTAEKSEYAIYNTITYCNIESFDQSTYDKLAGRKDIVNAFCFFNAKNEDYVLVGWLGNKPGNWFPLGEGKFISSEDSAKTAYVSSNIAQYTPDKTQIISIHGWEYEIVGSSTLWGLNLTNGLDEAFVSEYISEDSFVFVDLKELLDMDISNACLRIQFESPEHRDAGSFRRIANELFDSNYQPAILPADPLSDYMLTNAVFFVLVGLLCLLSYMNIVAMYWYFLSVQNRRFQIYAIVGAKPKTLLSVLLLQYFAMFAVSYVLSIIVALAAKSLFRMIQVEYLLTPRNLVFVFVFEFIITLAISWPKIKNVIIVNRDKGAILRRGNG